jgi:hypothetical protein
MGNPFRHDSIISTLSVWSDGSPGELACRDLSESFQNVSESLKSTRQEFEPPYATPDRFNAQPSVF